MNASNTRNAIASALQGIATATFTDAGRKLLAALGYRSDRTLDGQTGNVADFITHPNTAIEYTFTQQATFAALIFQVTSNEIGVIAQGQQMLIPAAGFDHQDLAQSFLFMAVELKGKHYPRGQYANFTRAINKRFPAPTVVLFKTADDLLTLAFVHRRMNQRDPKRDVLGSVSLVREIDPTNPHRAHLDILQDLSLEKRLGWMNANGMPYNFDGLLAAWLDALDTEELNRQFYRDLFAWFSRATQEATFPTKEAKTLPPEEHIIRLITRLLFVWFIKEKGLIAEELFVEANVKALLHDYDPVNGDSYYRAILQNLFFATLNTEINRRDFSKASNTTHRDPSRYRYANEIADSDSLLQLFAQTPFINGGLFDCLDSYEASNQGGYRIDCFSDNPNQRKDYSIPNRLFFDDNGLLPLFNRYKFTVEENTPTEQEVALDPELLGKVFENLLAAYNPETRTTARRQTGSYYTPRPVVDFMVDEALAAALATRCQPTDGDAVFWRDRLRYLLDYADAFDDANELFEEHECEDIVRAIAHLTVLDPAVGSGAFPMGVLHKLTLALRRLDPQNILWEKLQKEIARKRADLAFDTQDQHERDAELTNISATFERYRDSDFGRKLYLIQNSIFGVDIQTIATQIAKLRFFISLAIEQEPDPRADNYGIKPLPNLETRFVAANTLLALEQIPQIPLAQTIDSITQLQSELNTNRERYFHATARQQKSACKEKDRRLRNDLAAELKKIDMPAADADKIAQWDPYDQNASADWFDPTYMFGVSKGFDVVIGNPPYINSRDMSKGDQAEIRKSIKKTYKWAKGSWDIYIAFFELGFRLMTDHGILTFITPDKWLSKPFGQVFRTSSIRNISSLLKAGREIFESTNVDSLVSLFTYKENRDIDISIFKDGKSQTLRSVSKTSLSPPFTFDFLFSRHLDFIARLNSLEGSLSDYATCENSCATNDAYKLKPFIFDLKENFSEDYLKVVNTGTIGKYYNRWGRRKMVYLGEKYLCPVVSKRNFLGVFENRAYARRSLRSKLIIKGLNLLDVCLDYDGIIIPGIPTLVIVSNEISRLKLLLSILSSKLSIFYIKERYPASSYNQGINFTPDMINNFPIPKITTEKQCSFIRLVDSILSAKDADPAADTSELEAEIDRLVYTVYGLTDEEIAVVEGGRD